MKNHLHLSISLEACIVPNNVDTCEQKSRVYRF
jgi:hypothetical protein